MEAKGHLQASSWSETKSTRRSYLTSTRMPSRLGNLEWRRGKATVVALGTDPPSPDARPTCYRPPTILSKKRDVFRMADDDPFAVFGDDEEGENGPETSYEKPDVLMVARSLANQVNESMAFGKNNKASKDTSFEAVAPTYTSNVASRILKIPIEKETIQLPWPMPLYMSPNVAVSSRLDCFGGGRGLVAASPVTSGTLLMVEEALVLWPAPNVIIDLDLIAFLLQQPNASGILHPLEHFYPTKTLVDKMFHEEGVAKTGDKSSCSPNGDISDASNMSPNRKVENPSTKDTVDQQLRGMILKYENQYGEESEQITSLIQFALVSNIHNSDTTAFGRLDILRLLVALRYNSLETGIFLFAAMLNHADVPNCVKFRGPNNHNPSGTQSSLSEIRAIRPIAQGEPLTISYLPKLLSHSSRRWQLWDHHRFDIGVSFERNPWLYAMELIGNRLPPSQIQPLLMDDRGSINEEEGYPIQRRIEKTTSQLEEELQEIIKNGQPLSNVTSDSSSKSGGSPSYLVRLPADEIERAKALEIAALQLAETAQDQLQNQQHILLLSCRELHLQSCDLLLQQDQLQQNILPSVSQRSRFFGRLIVTALHLWQLQELIYGQDYFSLAETLLELTQAVDHLLSINSSYLSSTLATEIPEGILEWLERRHPRGIPSFSRAKNNISVWTSLEHYARQEHKRIKSLYPIDVDRFIPECKETAPNGR